MGMQNYPLCEPKFDKVNINLLPMSKALLKLKSVPAKNVLFHDQQATIF
jgi:hypothetical protein